MALPGLDIISLSAFECITEFGAVSVKGGSHTHHVNVSTIYVLTKHV